MFTTLRYVKDTALIPEREGHVLSHLACKACRSKKLKCTGESNGCRRCRTKDSTCTYPNPSSKTRRSKDIQKRAKSKQTIPLAARSSLPLNTEHAALEQSVSSRELSPALPSPWTSAALSCSPDSSFLDVFLENGSVSQELIFSSEDLQVEGAGFFALDQYSLFNEFLGTGAQITPGQDLVNNSPNLSSSFSSSEDQASPNTEHWRTFPSPHLPATGSQIQGLPTNPSSSTTSTSATLCNCLHSALHMLSALTINESSIRNIPRTIRLNKYVLQQSKTSFSCISCSGATAASIMTILTVLCQKVISSYEHVISLLARQYYEIHNLSMDNVPVYLLAYDDAEVREEGSEQLFQLRDYEVEKSEEPCLFSGLVTLQLGILRAFLLRLKGVPENSTGDYLTLLDSVDKRVIKLGRYCSSSCEV